MKIMDHIKNNENHEKSTTVYNIDFQWPNQKKVSNLNELIFLIYLF